MKSTLKKTICLILILSLALCTLTACTTFDNFRNAFFNKNSSETTAEKIVIGVYEPLSGELKAYGEAEKKGIELAHELVPQVLNKDIELVYANNKGSLSVGETVIQELLKQNPSAIIGSYGEAVTLAAGDYIKGASVPTITPSSTNPLITGNNPYYFCATFSEEKQGGAVAEFIVNKQGIKSAATVRVESDDTATGMLKEFKKKMSGLKGTVSGNYEIGAAIGDYTDIISELKKSATRAVFLAVSPVLAKEFISQAEKQGLRNTIFVGTRGWNDENFVEYAKTIPGYRIAYPSDYKADASINEMSKKFLELYQEKYGENSIPEEGTALAFDAYLMVVQAIENAYSNITSKSLNDIKKLNTTEASFKAAKEEWENAIKTGIPSGKSIRDEILKIKNFEGASGDITFNGSNEATKQVVISFVQDF